MTSRQRIVQPTGDTHNFGRHVEARGRRMWKPRTLFWEWLFLSAQSPLRKFLAEASRAPLGEDAFAFLPDLKFSQPRSLGKEGEVERISLLPLGTLGAGERARLAKIVGRAAALWSWFGVSDLHWENIVLGRDRGGNMIFSPVDIELIFSELGTPMETQLFPAANSVYREIVQHAAGVRRVLPYLGKPVRVTDALAMATAYRATLLFLRVHSRKIAALLSSLPLMHTAPIRICIRGTSDYAQLRNDPTLALWPPLLPEEHEQLQRGDIPYFFHRYGAPDVHRFTNATRTRSAPVDSLKGLGKTERVLQLANQLRPKSRAELLTRGTFAILAAFDHPGFDGHHATDEVDARFTSRTITLDFADGTGWSTKRNLRAFVQSVYLSCRCGESRTVFAHATARDHHGT